MPSSTSSSEPRRWGRTWLVAGVLTLALLGGWELFWRGRGFAPAPRDDSTLWALTRSRVSRAGPGAVVFVGSSRVEVAIDPEAFREASGWSDLYQLAIPMGSPGPVLHDLAADPEFSGRVVVGVNPQYVFGPQHLPGLATRGYMDAYADFTPADAVEARLRLGVQRLRVADLPPLHPARVVDALRTGTWPQSHHVQLDPERFGSFAMDPRGVDALAGKRAAAREARPREGPGPGRLAALIAFYAEAVQGIRARGGDVVFVRMPSAGAVREFEERVYPRARYWDVFAREVGAVAIHFEDHPELQGYDIPDGSHLGVRSRAEFSRALARLLVEAFGRRAAPARAP